MLSCIKTCALTGIDGCIIDVETDICNGIPVFDIVGLAGTAVKEAKERVRAAIKNSGMDFPLKRVTINMAPAYIRKEGTAYDLPIAIGILSAMGYVHPEKAVKALFMGELALDGEIRPVRGALSMAVCAKENGFKQILLPLENCEEAALVKGIQVIPVTHLKEVIHCINELITIPPVHMDYEDYLFMENQEYSDGKPDFMDILGQNTAKRALEVAATGAHNVLMSGSPGCGKTMLARRLPSILPPLSFEEALQVTKIYSISGLLNHKTPIMTERPFRSPHHTVTTTALIGGGSIPKPGEVSLAHQGVLFLDEMPEFSRNALEVLRQPVEEGFVSLSRLNATVRYPSRHMLVAACNPCVCGYYFDDNRDCTCTPYQIKEYQGRISGPLLNRIDIQVEMPSVRYEELEKDRKYQYERKDGDKSGSASQTESSEIIRQRVMTVRNLQKERYREFGISTNSELSGNLLREFCHMDKSAANILKLTFDKLGMSVRAYDRILKVSRTIADMDNSDIISDRHVAEAIQYRCMDRRRA